MTGSVSRRFAVGAVAVAAMTFVMLPSAAAKQPAPAPHITVTPNNVMFDATVTLVGKHFAPNTNLHLRECGAKSWVVTEHACSKGHTKVKTDNYGGFTTPFDVSICPMIRDWPGHPINERRCFVGDPTPSGVDTINLIGHARVIITYP
jgi:hypothetical protein